MSDPKNPQGDQPDPNPGGQQYPGGQQHPGGPPYQGGQQHPGGPPYQGGQPYPGQYGGPPPEKPKKKRWLLWVILAIVAAVVVGCIATISGGSSDTAVVKDGSGEDGSSETNDGVDFSGKTKKDTGANAGATVDKKGVEVTSEPLQEVSQQYGGPLLCTSVTIVNNTDKQERFSGYLDWKLQDPNGVAKDATFSMDIDTLESGELAPGGRTQGEVCFDNPGAPGEYVVLTETLFSFDSSRIGWVNTL